jgi:dTMP kinase
MLEVELRSSGVDFVSTFEPGDTPLGRRLRELFLETHEAIAPMAELLLFAADRAQHVEHLIKPALDEGRTVISDRYADATFAYQGAGRGFSETTVNQVIELATGGLKPDLTLFFDISVENALGRMNERDKAGAKTNRMDLEAREFYERVRNAYLKVRDNEPGRFRVIDANRTVEEIHIEVLQTMREFLGRAAGR